MAGILPQNRGNRGGNRTGSTVSRRLRAAGWNISPSSRKHKADGMFVTGFEGGATILVDLGVGSKNARVAQQVAEEIRAWPQASDVRVDPLNRGAVFVRFTYGASRA